MKEGTTPEKSLEDTILDLQNRLQNEINKKDLAFNYIKSIGRIQDFKDFCESPEGVDALKR